MMWKMQGSEIVSLLYLNHLFSVLKVCFQLSSHFENNVRVIMLIVLLICPKHYHF